MKRAIAARFRTAGPRAAVGLVTEVFATRTRPLVRRGRAMAGRIAISAGRSVLVLGGTGGGAVARRAVRRRRVGRALGERGGGNAEGGD
jgi:hypothetical protein